MKTPSPRGRTGRVLRALLKGSGLYFVICILAGTMLTLCELVIPQIIRVTVDSIIGNQPVDLPGWGLRIMGALGGVDSLRARMWAVALALAAIGLLSAVFRYLSGLFNGKAGETLVKTTRDLLYHRIQQLPWKWHAENPTGDVIQRCTSDVERIKSFFQEQFVIVFRLVVMIVLALVFMIGMNFRLSLVAIIMLPIVVSYSVHFHNKIRRGFTDCDENEGVLSTIAQENLTGGRRGGLLGRGRFHQLPAGDAGGDLRQRAVRPW